MKKTVMTAFGALSLAAWGFAGAAGAQGEPTLETLEQALVRYETAVALELGDGAVCLQQDQAQFLSRRDACGDDAICRRALVLDRLGMLDGLNPGELALDIALPVVPMLVAAVPPEPEAEPSDPEAEDISFEGEVIREHTDIMNMGYAVRDAQGAAHVIVLDMAIDQRVSHEKLMRLSHYAPEGPYRVTGRAHNGGFAMDQCRMVWLLSAE